MRLLRTQEVAGRLGLHPASVRRLATQGEIPYVQAGGWRLFEARAVEVLRRKRADRGARRGRSQALQTADAGRDDTPMPGSAEGERQNE
jgi:excisionase family DNA binding protein